MTPVIKDGTARESDLSSQNGREITNSPRAFPGRLICRQWVATESEGSRIVSEPKGTAMGRLDSIENWIALARQAAYSADILANVCGVSASHLRRHFHSIFRRSPQDWLNELRLWHAMQLVCEGMLIKQVAANLNFSGASHLCNRFREYHGCTPRECYCLFRKRQKRFGVEGTGNDVMLPWKAAEYRLGIQVRDNTVVVNFNVDSQCQADVLLAGRVS